jgi:hypothetical protein
MILTDTLAVVLLLVGPSMPDRQQVLTQTRRDTLALQVRGWVLGCQTHPIKNVLLKIF